MAKRGRKKVLTKRQREKHIAASVSDYQKKATRCINVRFHITNDSDVLAKLDSVENKADYIRQLVRRDIETNKK